MRSTPRRVALLGASGLVGRALVTTLLADLGITALHLLLRKPLTDLPDDARVQQHLCNFSEPSTWQHLLGVDAVFCTLGTTIKKAGSQTAFRAVDYDLVVQAARLAKQAGTKHFLVVSALGADRHSRVFYNRIKGEMEVELREVLLLKLSIFRPSLLAGPRQEVRVGEKIGLRLGSWLPLRWRPIPDTTVAKAMWRASREQQEAVRVYESKEMHLSR